jgi:hypothetical protein
MACFLDGFGLSVCCLRSLGGQYGIFQQLIALGR